MRRRVVLAGERTAAAAFDAVHDWKDRRRERIARVVRVADEQTILRVEDVVDTGVGRRIDLRPVAHAGVIVRQAGARRQWIERQVFQRDRVQTA